MTCNKKKQDMPSPPLPHEILCHIAGFCAIDERRVLIPPQRIHPLPSVVRAVSHAMAFGDHAILHLRFSNGSTAVMTRALAGDERSLSLYDTEGRTVEAWEEKNGRWFGPFVQSLTLMRLGIVRI